MACHLGLHCLQKPLLIVCGILRVTSEIINCTGQFLLNVSISRVEHKTVVTQTYF